MKVFRYELKYIVTRSEAELLKNMLFPLMKVDSNSLSNNKYLIRSVYFDDFNSTAYYEKIDGVEFRKKYRIRIYNNSDKVIKLECKYKHGNLTRKESAQISRALYEKFISGNVDDIFISDIKEGILKQFIIDMKHKKLKPVVIVDYERLALTYHLSDLRITFDLDIRSCGFKTDIFEPDLPTYRVLGDDRQVIEIKFNDYIPEHIAKVFAGMPMYRQAISKFAVCRSIL